MVHSPKRFPGVFPPVRYSQRLWKHRISRESKWTGDSQDAFFSTDVFERNRVINQPEYEFSSKLSKQQSYVISVDVGRKGCETVACVFKLTPQLQGSSIKTLVNIFVFNDEHFEQQAIWLKKLYYKYHARRIVIDGNGLGIGLMDYMVKSQADIETGETYPDFGVYNDNDNFYKKYKTTVTEEDAVYIIKANASLNTEIHANLQMQLSSGKVKFLIDDKTARAKLLGTKLGQAMTTDERNKYLLPFRLTSILRDELANLKQDNEGLNIILKRTNQKIGKDKVSALEYGLFYIRQEEESKKRKKFNAKDWLFLN